MKTTLTFAALALWAGTSLAPAEAQLTYPLEPLTAPGVTRVGADGDNNAAFLLTVPGKTFSFYGTTYTQVTLTDNGVLTFGNTNYFSNNPSNLGMPRGSFPGVWVAQDDWLLPDSSFTPRGYLYYKLYADGVAFTWANVRRGDGAGGGATNTFQAVLYNNGDIGVAYDDLNKVDRYVVGLNKGAGGAYASLTGVNTGTTAFNEIGVASVSQKAWRFRYDGTNYTAARSYKITGTLQFDSLSAAAPAQPITFTFRKTGSPDFTVTANVLPSGAFSVPGIPMGNYTMHVKGTRYLARNVTVFNANGDLNLPNPISLLAGDVTNNNTVDVDDLTALLTVYNTAAGDGMYVPNADLNLDGRVNVDDLTILLNNYNSTGNP